MNIKINLIALLISLSVVYIAFCSMTSKLSGELMFYAIIIGGLVYITVVCFNQLNK